MIKNASTNNSKAEFYSKKTCVLHGLRNAKPVEKNAETHCGWISIDIYDRFDLVFDKESHKHHHR